MRVLSLILSACLSLPALAEKVADPAIASVFERKIYASEIAAKPEELAGLKHLTPDNEAAFVLSLKRHALEQAILKRLTEFTLERNKVSIAAQDVEDYRRYINRKSTQQRMRLDAHESYIKKNPQPQIRQQIERIKRQRALARQPGDEPPGSWLKAMAQYHFHRLIYAGLGGRVIALSNGIFPVEAYNKYLDQLIADKHIVVYQNDYAAVFTSRISFDPASQSVRTAEEAQDYFAKPYWIIPQYGQVIPGRYPAPGT